MPAPRHEYWNHNTAYHPDPGAAARATGRLAGHLNVTVVRTDFERYAADGQRFDLITFVASLHHMDLRASLYNRHLLRWAK